MRQVYTALLTIIALQLGVLKATGQENLNPDSLQIVTKTGIAIVQNINNQTFYFLDEDMDGTADYKLNFGPFWYAPDEGNASRPGNGDTVKIKGGLKVCPSCSLEVIVVYEINDEYWRNPYEPHWNDWNNHYRSNRQGGQGYAPGWLDNGYSPVTTSGKVIVDTTVVYDKYYLDTNDDAVPDYRLNFGPYWYEPVSNIELPEIGETVDIEGILIPKNNLPVIMVLKLNDSTWRDTMGSGTQLVGNWIRKNMMVQQRINCVWDTGSYIIVPSNWHGGGMKDSFFMQFIPVMHQNMPQYQGENGFAAFEVGVFNKDQENEMKQQMWRMVFQNNFNYHLHYSQQLLNRYRHDESTIQLKRWNNQNQNWEQVHGVSHDTVSNTLTFSSSNLEGLFMLSAEAESSISHQSSSNLFSFRLYPDPAEHVVNISLIMQENTRTDITLLDMSGRVIARSERRFTAGEQLETFTVDGLKPGMYIIKVTTPRGMACQKFIRR